MTRFRFLHTSDWHLGRLFHGVHLTDDQAHILDLFVALAKETKPDAILIAGDVFDRAVPPPEAVELLDDTLVRLVMDLKVPVVMISGNHDSPVRLGFGSRLLAESGLFVRGAMNEGESPVILEGRHGTAAVYPLPYTEPASVREHLQAESALDQETALAARIERLEPTTAPVSILMTHAFVLGGNPSESERPLSVGGAETVSAALFSNFDFTALGHLHRPQNASGPQVHYSGSLLKYSFSEIPDQKTISLVEVRPQNPPEIERIALTPRRDLRRVQGRLAELLAGPQSGENPEDYLLVRLNDTGALLDAMGRLRDVYPNVLHIERPALLPDPEAQGSGPNPERLTEQELFSDFFHQVTGEDLSPDQKSLLAGILETGRLADREA